MLLAMGANNACGREAMDRLTGAISHEDVSFRIEGDVDRIGERDQAISWLERACAKRDSHLPLLGVDPRLAGLATEPRFQALLKSVGLNQTSR